MSESDVHKVAGAPTAGAIRQQCTKIATVVTDVLANPVPPLVEGHRPNLYDAGRGNGLIMLGEVEKLTSMRSRHTIRQLGTFLCYPQKRRVREATNILVYDGWTFWCFDGSRQWRLH